MKVDLTGSSNPLGYFSTKPPGKLHGASFCNIIDGPHCNVLEEKHALMNNYDKTLNFPQKRVEINLRFLGVKIRKSYAIILGKLLLR